MPSSCPGDTCPSCDALMGALKPKLVALARRSQREDKEVIAYVVKDGRGRLRLKSVVWGDAWHVNPVYPDLAPDESVRFIFHTHPRERHLEFSAGDLGDPDSAFLLLIPETGEYRAVQWRGEGESPRSIATASDIAVADHDLKAWERARRRELRNLRRYDTVCAGRMRPIPTPSGRPSRN